MPLARCGMTLAIRTLAADDPEMALLVAWRQIAFFDDWDRDPALDAADLRDLAAQGWPIMLAEWGGAPAGTAILSPDELEQPHDLSPWFCGLWTVPEFRGRGIGSALVRAAEAAAWRMGHTRLHLYTGADPDGAMAFYARLGWVESDRYTQDGWNGILMIRDLEP